MKSQSMNTLEATDPTIYVLKTNFDTVKYYSAYGYMASSKGKKSIPGPLLNIYRFVMQFELEEATIWLPDQIQVMLSDYSNSPEIPLQWPKDWPTPKSPAVGTSVSTFLS